MLARAIADEAEAAAAGDGGEPHACYVISHSIAKRQNLGTLARSCTAFNVKEVRAASPATRPPVTWAAPSSLRAHCGCVRRCWWWVEISTQVFETDLMARLEQARRPVTGIEVMQWWGRRVR